MRDVINIYCDESCHLEHDGQPAMVLGAIWCPLEAAYEANQRIREIKQAHDLPPDLEAKWTKVSPGGINLYRDLVDYFFDDDDLCFRAVVAPKGNLDHERFGQDHDTWYYKMYFTMLQTVIDPNAENRIYLDIKDTRGAEKVRKLHEVLCNANYDFDQRIIAGLQTVRSHEIGLLQLTDLLIGAVMSANRVFQADASSAKQGLVERVRERSGYTLTKTTLLKARKVNILIWRPSGGDSA
ncbi:MAG: DUF3800 domain-containing protein [Armatimonadota bacterium]|jgi:hypothetical protein